MIHLLFTLMCLGAAFFLSSSVVALLIIKQDGKHLTFLPNWSLILSGICGTIVIYVCLGLYLTTTVKENIPKAKYEIVKEPLYRQTP